MAERVVAWRVPSIVPIALHRRHPRVALAIVAGAAGLAALLAVLLVFGWGLLRPVAERRLAAALHRPVRIGGIARAGGGLFAPVLRITDVHVGQPAWAGPGEMLAVRAAQVRLPLWPLLAGHARPALERADGVVATLVRDRDGRANWEGERKGDNGGSGATELGRLLIRDAAVAIDDRQHGLRARLALASDAAGFRVTGAGTIDGAPATFTLMGGSTAAPGAWPFRAEVRSAKVGVVARGRMRRPLDVGLLQAHLDAHGDNLQALGQVIQTGLFDTQPFRLAADVAHDGPTWTLAGLAGMLGRSDLRGGLTVRRDAAGRTVLAGRLRSAAFDFDDLATDAQHARAAAEQARTGPRLVPSTRIDLAKLRRLDGTLHLSIGRLVSRTPSIFRSLDATVALDHGVLTAAPVVAGLAAGRITGTAVVRHRSGTPLLLLDLRMTGGSWQALFHGGVLAGPAGGRIRLAGHGATVRQAVAAGDGRIALAGRGGDLTRRVALILGADVGRGLFEGNRQRTGLRCAVGSFAVAHGVARAAPVVIDTDVGRADGRGTIRLADETLALQLFGTPRRASALRLNGPIVVTGTLSKPHFSPPPEARTAGGILKLIGKALGGGNHPADAPVADCAGLVARALR